MAYRKLYRLIIENAFILNIGAMLYSFISIVRATGYFRNNLQLKGAFLKQTKIKIKGKNNTLIIDAENRLINCFLYINGSNCDIHIGKHCCLKNTELWIEDNNGSIEIGYRTTIESAHIAATEGKSIQIGTDCMFSHNIQIRNGDSHAIYIEDKRINEAEDIIIGNHVWLGADSKVLKGTVIKDGSILASGAIATGVLNNNCIFAGIPAKKIKDSINWQRTR